jgi:TetR/AcrR family transcriptional regulator, transcriptional repressor for nem operon
MMTTRDKLLAAALKLILAKGYPGTAVDEMCEKAGVSKGSFYHFFKSKEDLGLAVLEHYLVVLQEALKRDHSAIPDDPIDSLLDHLLYSEKMAQKAWDGGCLLGTLAMDLGAVNPTIQRKVAGLFDQVLTRYEALFQNAFDAAGITHLSGEEVAREYITIIEGALILAKAYNDPSRLNQGLADFRKRLQARLG